MSDLLRRDLASGILRLTLDDPASRNSLSEAMLAALQAALDEAADDKAVRVVVIAASGPVFCSGHNLKEMTAQRAAPDKGAAYFAALFQTCARLMRSIVEHPKPVIAEVQGLASAAGCQLVASCDLAIAADTAGFCTPGVNIGLFCSAPMVALSRSVAPKHAMEMLLTGDIFAAREAERIGLINRAVSPNRLGEDVEAVARKIAAKSQATLATGKRAFQRQRDMDLEAAYAYAARVMAENMLARDAEEGIAALIGKRSPHWHDR
jgi:enoyl-CoA hydratase/carnithine racemase